MAAKIIPEKINHRARREIYFKGLYNLPLVRTVLCLPRGTGIPHSGVSKNREELSECCRPLQQRLRSCCNVAFGSWPRSRSVCRHPARGGGGKASCLAKCTCSAFGHRIYFSMCNAGAQSLTKPGLVGRAAAVLCFFLP